MNIQQKSSALKRRLAAGDTVLGCFLSLGSSLASELMGNAGYDWALVDLEHGAGGETEALHQMQALSGTPAAAIVRVESNARQRVHRVLDIGAHGIMFPRIDSAEEALAAAAAMHYPPLGVRGVAFSNRACEYGSNFRPYLEESDKALLTIVQIETRAAVENVDAIAGTAGVDVLFIGPSDLSHSYGVLGQFDHPDFCEAIERTVAAAKRYRKSLGILLPKPGDFARYHDLGFRFIASGSDAVLLNNTARALVKSIREMCVPV
ncbi:MAG: 2-dehydro-3-deoxyglucarate aldolase [Acidobacteria bacterium]|nr:2-dehydro-3-deoxyglucarate aldolase [Acidobacteriota bacterium]